MSFVNYYSTISPRTNVFFFLQKISFAVIQNFIEEYLFADYTQFVVILEDSFVFTTNLSSCLKISIFEKKHTMFFLFTVIPVLNLSKYSANFLTASLVGNVIKTFWVADTCFALIALFCESLAQKNWFFSLNFFTRWSEFSCSSHTLFHLEQ